MFASRVTPFATIATASLIAALALPVASHAATQVVDVRAAALQLSRSDLQALHGRYTMKDGRDVMVQARGRRLVVDLGDGREVALQARSPEHFASADGSVDLTFDTAANGVVERVQLTEAASR